MTEPVLTEEEQQLVAQLRDELESWFEEHVIGAQPADWIPEETIRLVRRQVAELNAKPLFERLEFLAELHDGDYDSIAETVLDVTWTVETVKGALVVSANMRLNRPVETVQFTARIT